MIWRFLRCACRRTWARYPATGLRGCRLARNSIVCLSRPDTIHGLQLRTGGCGLQTSVRRLFQGFDLLPQAVHNGQTAGDSQDVLGLGKHALEVCRRDRCCCNRDTPPVSPAR
jgi:hypothetical protein